MPRQRRPIGPIRQGGVIGGDIVLQRARHHPRRRAALLKQHPLSFWEAEYSTYEKLRFSRLCAWLRHQPRPDDSVGHSILLWRLDAAQLAAALIGPPVELADAPLRR